MEDSKKIKWYGLAFMAFSTVWGFGNVLNGFIYFNGIQVVFSWVLMFALYFVPYALMVGELGSAFKNSGGGVSSWVHETFGPKLAYYAGWTYWACHVTYIASKGSGGLKALSWAIFRNAEVYDSLPTLYVQLATLAVFLYILMMFAAPAINPNGGYLSLDFSFDKIVPQFNVNYFTSLSILVFAVGGCEKISPYVNKVENPSKGFPKGMIALAIMVMVCAILGTFAMGMMFDPTVINATPESFNSYVSNGAYWSFQKLGQYYHMGDALLIIYALCNMIGQFSTLVLSIDAPLRMLLDNEDARQFIPSKLLKQNKYGAYVNGIKMVVALSGSIILIQIIGGQGAAGVLAQLNKLNSVCMPMRYVWVFLAYIGLRKAYDKIPADYRFVKCQPVALFFGGWCLFVTAACCIMGVYSTDLFTMALNIITPVVLTALGLILPAIAKREKANAITE